MDEATFREKFIANAMEMTRQHAGNDADLASMALVETAAEEAVDYALSIDGRFEDEADPEEEEMRLWSHAEAFAIGYVTAWKNREEVHHDDG